MNDAPRAINGAPRLAESDRFDVLTTADDLDGSRFREMGRVVDGGLGCESAPVQGRFVVEQGRGVEVRTRLFLGVQEAGGRVYDPDDGRVVATLAAPGGASATLRKAAAALFAALGRDDVNRLLSVARAGRGKPPQKVDFEYDPHSGVVAYIAALEPKALRRGDARGGALGASGGVPSRRHARGFNPGIGR